jgi:hypothetical protein
MLSFLPLLEAVADGSDLAKIFYSGLSLVDERVFRATRGEKIKRPF